MEYSKQIVEFPSADVQPVRHGKWLDGYGYAGNYYDCFICDQCETESMAKTKKQKLALEITTLKEPFSFRQILLV